MHHRPRRTCTLFDIPLIRSADGEVWSILACRSLSTFLAALATWVVINRLLGRRAPLIPGKAEGLIAGLFYGINSFTFLLAVFNTSTRERRFHPGVHFDVRGDPLLDIPLGAPSKATF